MFKLTPSDTVVAKQAVTKENANTLNFPASDLITLTAVCTGKLKNADGVDAQNAIDEIGEAISNCLGEG